MMLAQGPFVLLGLTLLACSAGAGPSGPPPPASLGFTVLSPAEIDTKKLVEIVVRLDVAHSLAYPLRVTVEKANAGQDFFEVGQLAFQSSEQRTLTFRIPIAMDPTLRVTIAESEPAGISVTRTVAIDVLDFHLQREGPPAAP